MALVVQDSGLQASQMAQAIWEADVFRLQEVDATQAQALLKDVQVVAMITIPADFSQRVQAHQAATVNVRLIFRRAYAALMKQKGWTDPDILMEQATLQVPAN